MKKLVYGLIAAITLLTSLPAASSFALSGSDFQGGRIIDDSLFYNGAALSANEVQTFLNQQVPTCDTNGTQAYQATTRAAWGAAHGNPAPFVCLKDYQQQDTAQTVEAGVCNGITGGTKTAAQIIAEVGASCGVSQKALLVLLQVEQGLVTDDWPYSTSYDYAMGLGCPDTSACNANTLGFANQVYGAARLLKLYKQQPTSFSYKAGATNTIQYSPNTTCGSSQVYIQNQATASLYNYVPYQPNQAALSNLTGTGDSCSSYTLRNFWRYYNDWFGSTIAPAAPSPTSSITLNGTTFATAAYGSNVALAWTSQNASSCNVSPGNYGGTSGTVTLPNVTTNASYKVNCSGAGGSTTSSAQLTVLPPTFAYLKFLLKQTIAGSKVNSAELLPLNDKIDNAQTKFSKNKKDDAAQALQDTVDKVQKWVKNNQVKQSAADAYAAAVNALVKSWQPAPAPIPNGGYPAKWADAPIDSLIDNWGMYNRESVSYTAWKVYSTYGYMPYWGGNGNANQWPGNARAMGIPVDSTPAVASVAVNMVGIYGITYWVDSIAPDGTLTVSTYNQQFTGQYSQQQISPAQAAKLLYIHFQ